MYFYNFVHQSEFRSHANFFVHEKQFTVDELKEMHTKVVTDFANEARAYLKEKADPNNKTTTYIKERISIDHIEGVNSRLIKEYGFIKPEITSFTVGYEGDGTDLFNNPYFDQKEYDKMVQLEEERKQKELELAKKRYEEEEKPKWDKLEKALKVGLENLENEQK